MALPIAGQVGPQVLQDGALVVPRLGRTGETVLQQLHGRFYEQNYRGNVYSANCGVTALSATTITLTNTSTPILGVWNPSTSTVNAVLLFANIMTVFNTWTTPTGPGALLWATSTGNTAISTGSSPLNRKSLASAGSQCKAFNGGTALTGLTNNLTIQGALNAPGIQGVGAYGTPSAPTAVQFTTLTGQHFFEGAVIIPPGGVFSIVNQISTTTSSAAGDLVWEEVAL